MNVPRTCEQTATLILLVAVCKLLQSSSGGIVGASALPGVSSHGPNIKTVWETSDIPQNDAGDFLGLCISIHLYSSLSLSIYICNVIYR